MIQMYEKVKSIVRFYEKLKTDLVDTNKRPQKCPQLEVLFTVEEGWQT